MKYKFIEDSNVHEFEKKVQEAIKGGWKLHVNVTCTSCNAPEYTEPLYTSYCREMTKQED